MARLERRSGHPATNPTSRPSDSRGLWSGSLGQWAKPLPANSAGARACGGSKGSSPSPAPGHTLGKLGHAPQAREPASAAGNLGPSESPCPYIEKPASGGVNSGQNGGFPRAPASSWRLIGLRQWRLHPLSEEPEASRIAVWEAMSRFGPRTYRRRRLGFLIPMPRGMRILS